MIVLIVTYGLVLLLVIWLVALTKPLLETDKNTDVNPITFIIPFKNEAERIQPLIQSFNQADWHTNFEVIFIDDHSRDNTVDILLADLDIPFRLLKLRETSGKKTAIVCGVSNASREQIHTLDADVAFNPNFLTNISQLPKSDLTILPVKLSGNSLLQSLNKIEFQWLQTFTFALAKLKSPVLCNGANLSFSKTVFLETLPLRNDFNEASGDDIYLLQSIIEKKGNIKFNSAPHNTVQTPAPDNFLSLISQRKRWVKKVLNGPTILMLLAYAIYHTIPFYCLLNLKTSIFWLLPFVFKISAEWILSRQYTLRQLSMVILHQVYYVLYGIVLMISLFFKVVWK